MLRNFARRRVTAAIRATGLPPDQARLHANLMIDGLGPLNLLYLSLRRPHVNAGSTEISIPVDADPDAR